MAYFVCMHINRNDNVCSLLPSLPPRPRLKSVYSTYADLLRHRYPNTVSSRSILVCH